MHAAGPLGDTGTLACQGQWLVHKTFTITSSQGLQLNEYLPFLQAQLALQQLFALVAVAWRVLLAPHQPDKAAAADVGHQTVDLTLNEGDHSPGPSSAEQVLPEDLLWLATLLQWGPLCGSHPATIGAWASTLVKVCMPVNSTGGCCGKAKQLPGCTAALSNKRCTWSWSSKQPLVKLHTRCKKWRSLQAVATVCVNCRCCSSQACPGQMLCLHMCWTPRHASCE